MSERGSRMSPRNELEDWLTELPPLDGGDDEPESTDGLAEDLVLDDQDDLSLDDSASDDLEVDDGVDTADEEPASDDDENWEADVGEPVLDLTDDEPSGADADGPGVSDSDLDVDEDLPTSDDDAGEEGTTDPIEHSLDEELPALDSDDEGDFEDALLLEVGMAAASHEAFPWARPSWEERAGSSKPFWWPVTEDDSVTLMSILPSADVLGAVTSGGAVMIARPPTVDMVARPPTVDMVARPPTVDTSAGETKMTACTNLARTALDDGTPTLLAVSGSRHPVIWVAGRAGQLAKSADLGKTWSRCAGLGRPILALGTREDGSISALARRGEVLEMLTSADGTRWFAQRISAEMPPASRGASAAVWVSHRGPAIAIGHAGGVWISRDGKHFSKVAGSAAPLAGAFAGTAADSPLVFACASIENDETTHLVRVTFEGRAEIIAELGPGDASDERVDPQRVLALAWDQTQGTVRVAFATHLCAWGPAAKDLT